MALRKTFVCDCGCGAERGEENHWWLMTTTAHSQVIMPWGASNAPDSLSYKHAAGSECVHKLLSQWMEQQREGK